MRSIAPSDLADRARAASLTPYVMATPLVQSSLHLDPGGLTVAEEHRVDPRRVAGSRFMDAIQRLDVALYGARNLTAPRWALYDCAGLPGAVIGFAKRQSDLTEGERGRLTAPDSEDEIVPVSMMIATPMLGDRRWLVYTIGSASSEQVDVLTLQLGLAMLDANEITATVQWDAPELSVLATLSPLRVRAAWLPVHEIPATCVLSVRPPSQRGDASSQPTDHIDPRDATALRSLQRDVERGVTITIAGPLATERSSARVPLHKQPKAPA